MRLPRFLLTHRVTIEPYAGEGADGAVYGAAVSNVRCLQEAKRRMVRNSEGTEVVSETTLYCPPGTVAPPESRVTLTGGQVTTVITNSDRDGGGLPTPDHVELALE